MNTIESDSLCAFTQQALSFRTYPETLYYVANESNATEPQTVFYLAEDQDDTDDVEPCDNATATNEELRLMIAENQAHIDNLMHANITLVKMMREMQEVKSQP